MIPEQTLLSYPVFGDNATKVEPDNNKKSNGWQQGDVVPAEWMNWGWYHNSKGITDLNKGVTSMEKEINSVLSSFGITPAELTNNQLLTALRLNASFVTASSTTITGPLLVSGGTIRVLFTAALTGSNTTTGLSLTYNTQSIAVKVNKNGAKANFVATEVSTGTYKYLQAYTTLELVYDGVDFLIVGNPVVLSGSNYTVYADGKKGVDDSHPVNSIYIQYPSQSAPSDLFGLTTWTDISSTYAGAFFRATGGNAAAFGTKQNEGLPNITGSMEIRLGASSGYIRSLAVSEGNGALSSDYTGTVPNMPANSEVANKPTGIKLDASKSSNIYGSSSHVTPENYAIKIWKRTA